MKDLSFTATGDLIIPGDRLGSFKGAASDALRLQELGEDLLVSMRQQPGLRSRPLLYGDLRLFHVAELMALISSMRRDGALTLLVPHAKKTLTFASGEVVYAASNVEDDRLGEALWRLGLLSLEQLSDVHDLVTPRKKLGAVLVEKGMLTPRQLYAGIQHQVQEIVYSTFHFRSGEFLFQEGGAKVLGAVRLELSTREILMEGVRRVEEMTRLEELFPDRGAVPVPRPIQLDVKLGEAERFVRKLVDGRKDVSQIVIESRLGELEGLRALAHLRRLGLIEVRPGAQPQAPAIPIPEVLEHWARILRVLHQTLKAERPEYVKRLEAYLGAPSPKHREVFRGVGFDNDGRLDMETLLRNAKALNSDNPRDLALDAVSGFFDYALFQALDVLDPEASEALNQRITALRQKAAAAEG